MIRQWTPFLLALPIFACSGAGNIPEDVGTATEAYLTDLGAIRNRGLCLDVYAFNTRNGYNTLALWDCNGLINQRWRFNPDTHEISSAYSGKCLDNIGFDNVSVGMWDCNGLRSQRWWPSNGRLINEQAGKCLRSQWWTHSPGNMGTGHGDGATGGAVFLAGCQDGEWQTYEIFSWL